MILLYSPTAAYNCSATVVSAAADISIYGRLVNPKVILSVPFSYDAQVEGDQSGVVDDVPTQAIGDALTVVRSSPKNRIGYWTNAVQPLHRGMGVAVFNSSYVYTPVSDTNPTMFTMSAHVTVPWILQKVPNSAIGCTPFDIVMASFALARGSTSWTPYLETDPAFVFSSASMVTAAPSTYFATHGGSKLMIPGVNGVSPRTPTALEWSVITASQAGVKMSSVSLGFPSTGPWTTAGQQERIGPGVLVKGGESFPYSHNFSGAVAQMPPSGLNALREAPIRIPFEHPEIWHWVAPGGVNSANRVVDVQMPCFDFVVFGKTLTGTASSGNAITMTQPRMGFNTSCCDDFRVAGYRPPIGLTVLTSAFASYATSEASYTTNRYVTE
jgi:hypothetical protein